MNSKVRFRSEWISWIAFSHLLNSLKINCVGDEIRYQQLWAGFTKFFQVINIYKILFYLIYKKFPEISFRINSSILEEKITSISNFLSISQISWNLSSEKNIDSA